VASERTFDSSYEWKAVALLSVGFGLVGLDRFLIVPLFPAIMKDLGLGYQELGQITGILSIAWGCAAFATGRLSDVIGRRKTVVSAILLFSVLVGISGLATSLFMLLTMRAIMGLADGAFTPPSITATLEASKPTRHGLNLGIQQAMLPLFGLGLAPIIVTQLLHFLNWRWIFALLTPPGLIVAFLLYKVLRDAPPQVKAEHTATHDASGHKWTDVFKVRNVWLNMLCMLCWLTCLIVTSALLPNYLIDYLKLNVTQMGLVLSAIGFGAALGTIVLPAISDRLGRKPVMIFATLCGAISVIFFIRTGAQPAALFGLLFLTHFFNFGCLNLTVGPLSAESVPARLMSTATGVAVCVGEIFGGGIAPIIAGFVATVAGIQYILYLAAGAMAAGFVTSLFLNETAPIRLRVKAKKALA
jgi:predicted MFS family arabinose efflux permease